MNHLDTPPASPPDDDEIDLFELWETIVQNKWLVIAVTALCLSTATALAFIMTPKYEGKVLASYADDGKSSGGLGAALASQFGGVADMAGLSLGGGGNNENYLAYLKSRVFLETFIEENDLLPILYAKKWDAANKKWLVDDPDDAPTLWKAYNLFSKKIINIQVEKKTNLITLTVLWKDREQAVAWANRLIQRANANLRAKAITETQQSLSYLEKELAKTSVVEVQNTIYRVMETQIKTMMMANTQEQFAFKVIDPARLMDKDAFVQPRRLLMIALGAIGGLFAGVLLVFLRQALRNRKQRLAS